jgi:hypothetical protein
MPMTQRAAAITVERWKFIKLSRRRFHSDS